MQATTTNLSVAGLNSLYIYFSTVDMFDVLKGAILCSWLVICCEQGYYMSGIYILFFLFALCDLIF